MSVLKADRESTKKDVEDAERKTRRDAVTSARALAVGKAGRLML